MNSTRTSHVRIHLIGPGGAGPVQRPGPLRKLLAGVVGAAILVGAFMLSIVVLAAVTVAGLVGGTWLWWRTRDLRQRLREQAAARTQADGHVIEGEVIRDGEAGRQH